MKHMDALTSGLFTVQIHLNDLIETEIALEKNAKTMCRCSLLWYMY